MKNIKKLCCDDFYKAQFSGTDNEMYGSLISYFEMLNTYNMGCDLPPINYCPWCGYDLYPIENEEA